MEIHEVAGWTLPAPVVASEVSEHEDGWSCVFDGWEVTRFLRPTEKAPDVPVVLRGEFDDGSSFVADAKIRLVLKEPH